MIVNTDNEHEIMIIFEYYFIDCIHVTIVKRKCYNDDFIFHIVHIIIIFHIL